jgi:hypothetical protein
LEEVLDQASSQETQNPGPAGVYVHAHACKDVEVGDTGLEPVTPSLSKNPENPRKSPVFPRISSILVASMAFASCRERLRFLARKRGILEQSGGGNPVDYRIGQNTGFLPPTVPSA